MHEKRGDGWLPASDLFDRQWVELEVQPWERKVSDPPPSQQARRRTGADTQGAAAPEGEVER